jgi:hypothetical protein
MIRMVDSFLPTIPIEIINEKHWLTYRVSARYGREFPVSYSIT